MESTANTESTPTAEKLILGFLQKIEIDANVHNVTEVISECHDIAYFK